MQSEPSRLWRMTEIAPGVSRAVDFVAHPWLGSAVIKARIFQQGAPATQSGRARSQAWILEHEPVEANRPDPLMGWAGSGDTAQQVRLTFPSLEAALGYARRHWLDAQVVAPVPKRLIIQSYAENFR